MKWTSAVLAVLAASALTLLGSGWSGDARAQDASTSCINDVDCTGNGTACGTDVCNWNMGKICVPADSASLQDNWCGGSYATPYDQATADMECKCYAQGATCMNFHCSIWVLDAGASGASSGTATGASGAASSGSPATEDAGSSSGASMGGSGGESSGACSVAFAGEGSALPLGALGAFALASCAAAARRRKRYVGALDSNDEPGSVK